MSITIRVLQANHGDSILVAHVGPKGVFNVLIDGGTGSTFRYGPRERYAGALCQTLDKLKEKNQCIDLAVLTHIDDDHIEGLIRAFEAPGYLTEMVRSIWFNSSQLITTNFDIEAIPENNIYLKSDSPETTIAQGKELDALLSEIACQRGPLILAGQVHVMGPFKFTILSPDKNGLEKLLHKWPAETELGETSSHTNDYSLSLGEIWKDDPFRRDASPYNGSSIAFIMDADEKRMLFLGDAHDEVIVQSLRDLGFSEKNKLEVELVKISHHGSERNTSVEFLSIINAQRYVISTNGSKHGLPNKRTIARILASGAGKIVFNYSEIIHRLLLKHEVQQFGNRLEAFPEEIGL